MNRLRRVVPYPLFWRGALPSTDGGGGRNRSWTFWRDVEWCSMHGLFLRIKKHHPPCRLVNFVYCIRDWPQTCKHMYILKHGVKDAVYPVTPGSPLGMRKTENFNPHVHSQGVFFLGAVVESSDRMKQSVRYHLFVQRVWSVVAIKVHPWLKQFWFLHRFFPLSYWSVFFFLMKKIWRTNRWFKSVREHGWGCKFDEQHYSMMSKVKSAEGIVGVPCLAETL